MKRRRSFVVSISDVTKLKGDLNDFEIELYTERGYSALFKEEAFVHADLVHFFANYASIRILNNNGEAEAELQTPKSNIGFILGLM